MPENYFTSIRRQQKQNLLEWLRDHKTQSTKEALATFSLKTGLRVATLEIYLKELIDAGAVIENK
jgi:hypothetical protein